MPVNITSGNILPGVLYAVSGAQSVIYNTITYTSGQNFRGVSGAKTFTFSGTGSQLVYEVFEIRGAVIDIAQNALDYGSSEPVKFYGFAIEYLQSGPDIIVPDVTALKGFALELLDYPFYSFEITETRL